MNQWYGRAEDKKKTCVATKPPIHQSTNTRVRDAKVGDKGRWVTREAGGPTHPDVARYRNKVECV